MTDVLARPSALGYVEDSLETEAFQVSSNSGPASLEWESVLD